MIQSSQSSKNRWATRELWLRNITGEKQSPDYHTALLGKSVQTQLGAENAAAISSELYTPEPINELRGVPFINCSPNSCLEHQSSFSKWLSSRAILQVKWAGKTAPAVCHGPTRMCSSTSPQDAAVIRGRPHFNSNPPPHLSLNIRPPEPPQLNGPGSISKAAESITALSAIQYHKVCSFGRVVVVIWQLWAAPKQNYSEELTTLCP